MSEIERLRRQGWSFNFNPVTRYINAEHSNGGQFPVLEVKLFSQNADANAIGRELSATLNAAAIDSKVAA